MFDQLADDLDVPELDLSDRRVTELLGDIKRNSRNRRIALMSVFVLAAAVISATLAAPAQHGGLALIADADSPDPALPRVFGSNGEWYVAEPIQEAPVGDPGPADMIQAATEPAEPTFTLAPPTGEDLQSFPASTSTPPTSTSGQTPDSSAPESLGESAFSAVIRIESEPDPAAPVEASDDDPARNDDPARTDIADRDAAAEAAVDDPSDEASATETISTPDPATSVQDPAPPDTSSSDEDVTVAVQPQNEPTADRTEANPSTPTGDPDDSDAAVFSAPASIEPLSVLVHSAHVAVTVQVVDDDSTFIDWCNTRVDWGDGSVTRASGAGDIDSCTASCEYESTSPASGSFSNGVSTTLAFEHTYLMSIDAAPRVYVASGDGCSYTLAELELPSFTVDPQS